MALFNTYPLHVVNSLSGKKELFVPQIEGKVGMYVCGPTVYSDVHLGNVRTFMSFDMIYRYLTHLGYKVRYVRNITDVGHLVGDADEGEDKIAKKAKLEQIEPMEVVQRYTNNFHEVMQLFNLLPPSIEPTATGHIMEQITMIEEIIANGYAYEVNGSVYFNVRKYNEKHAYGELSGRNIDDLLVNTRELDGQDEKQDPLDFALWKKADDHHIMRWKSPWGVGFPGWHLECSVMSTKYLGTTFDIHGGGMDLKFPHHECEIAQNVGASGKSPVNYWLHGNMLTVEGKKMAKSEGNGFTPEQLLSGDHKLLERGYDAMTIRFFVLQAHYRSTLDFSNSALQAAEKGLARLMDAISIAEKVELSDFAEGKATQQVNEIFDAVYKNMSDDFNTAKALAELFDLCSLVQTAKTKGGKEIGLSKKAWHRIKKEFPAFVKDVLGLQSSSASQGNSELAESLVEMLLEMRLEARANKDFATSDRIRDQLSALGVTIKDGPDKTEFSIS